MENQYGKIEIHLDKLLSERNMSKAQLSYKAQLTRTQINKLCRKEVSRFDLATLSRLCTALECTISDLLVFIPADNETTPPN